MFFKKRTVDKKKGVSNEREGKLAIDLYQTEKEIVIISTIAGIKSENLDISLENEILTIKGKRENPVIEKKDYKRHSPIQPHLRGENYIYQECYWGPFSRKIFLPEKIDIKKIEAIIKNGILILKLPKIEEEKIKKIEIKEIE